ALPGVFEANPYRSPLGTVWTLKYETLCYLAVLLFGLLGLLRWRWLSLGLVAGLAVALVAAELRHPDLPKGTETAFRLPMIFASGGALYLWRDRGRLSPWWLLALPATLLLQGTPLYRSALFLAEAYAAIGIALLPMLARPRLDPPADLSYGVYLYGWPIQQTLHALWPQGSGWALLGPSIVLALGVAALSWYAIEKPALGLKARALGRRTLGTIEPAGP
ncbi:MAG: acyltransferase, partial [Methylobacterium sp.]